MKLSIIIVNFNVKYFLEQCLYSVKKAIKNIEAEVIVVDNASTDGSLPYLQAKFDRVTFIGNPKNTGFASANNQALESCKGEYVLFLNPDTILAEDTLDSCLSFIDKNPGAGGLGIRMVDGSGNFLPESKRSFPTPLTSFFKLVGLSKVFPKSKLVGKYALGYLDQRQNHEVDVLAGAFLLGRRELLLKLKGFDETFFMYGEDIDLSYRIQKEGFKNYYFSESSIIHFKGESTRKGSLNYVKMFYQAMSIFVEKHYAGGKAKLFQVILQLAIWARALVAAIAQLLVKIRLPLLDAIIIFGSFKMVNWAWIKYVRGGEGFIEEIVNVSLPGFTLVFLISATLAGIYDSRYKPIKALYAAIVATVIMLAGYSLLPEQYRFSRGVILFGGVAAIIFITFSRWVLQKNGLVKDDYETSRQNKTLIVGSAQEYEEVLQLLRNAGLEERVIGRIAINGSKEDAVGTLDKLPALLLNFHSKEVIFCTGTLSYKQVIAYIQTLPSDIELRFHAKGSESIIGSTSKDSSGEVVALEGNYAISQPYQRRMKRIVDLAVALTLLITFPVHLIFAGPASVYNALLVLVGKKTWVSYAQAKNLPVIPDGILSTTGSPFKAAALQMPGEEQVDKLYARHFDWRTDVKMILKNYRKLGGKA
ncbi:MAG: glycosyltransferase [Segetibacter sp.]|nr:glycosyltransferase [Segetibacter sp.]